MDVTIPDSLKTDMPRNLWGKLLAATPVVMTVVATMLAGLSSSEMTRASMIIARRQQAKAGDQGPLQAKRLRGTGMRTADVLQAAAEVESSNPRPQTDHRRLVQNLQRCDDLARHLRRAGRSGLVGKGWAVASRRSSMPTCRLPPRVRRQPRSGLPIDCPAGGRDHGRGHGRLLQRRGPRRGRCRGRLRAPAGVEKGARLRAAAVLSRITGTATLSDGPRRSGLDDRIRPVTAEATNWIPSAANSSSRGDAPAGSPRRGSAG